LPYVEAQVTIARPLDEVFEFLADGLSAPQWMPWVTESTLLGYGGGVGATYSLRTVSSLLGRKRVVCRIVNFHSPVTLGVEAASLPGRPTARFRLAPTSAGSTSVTVRAEFPDLGSAANAGSIGRRWATHLVESLPRVKSALESSSPAGGTA